jgi:hypothetical protein
MRLTPPSSAEAVSAAAAAAAAAAAEATLKQRTRWWSGRRSGVTLPVPAGFPAEATFPGDLEVGARGMRLAGELLHIARPLVYVASR